MTRLTLNSRFWYGAALLGFIGLVPILSGLAQQPYYLNVFARIMVWAIAAISLNFILGYGGMISFGHAAFLGIGAYTVGICAYYGIDNALIQWPLALGIAALVALVFGAISLRTRGVYFIMITMALAQMVYFLAVSAEEYGSDDGLVIYARSQLGGGWLNLDHPWQRYYAIFAVLIGCLYLTRRLVNSRFGMVLRGARSNEARMAAIGFSVYRFRLLAFVIAGVMCALAGVMSANLEKFVSPESMTWTVSGNLIFMIILGGTGSLLGPLTGALLFGLLSESLSQITAHWQLIFGPFLILVVLFARRGVDGLFDRRPPAGG